MKIPPLYLTYVFSQKEFENNFLHKIEISSYFEEKPFLNKEDLIKILELDNAYFYKNSVRFFNEEVNGFLKMPENFHLEIDENDPQVNLVILLKMRNQTITQTRFNSLQDEMKKLRSEMEQMRGIVGCMVKAPNIQHQESIFEKDGPNNNNNFLNPNPTLLLVPQTSFQLPRSASTYLTESQANNLVKNFNMKDSSMEGLVASSSQIEPPNDLDRYYPTISKTGDMTKKFMSNNFSSTTSARRRLDLAVLYSAPLVKKIEKTGVCIPLNDPVDFEEECLALRKMLKEQNKRIKLRVDVATIDNLTNLISKQPIIIHFICHGDYSTEKQKFYLAFENNFGELEECDSDRIRKLLSNENDHNNTQIVFVNACHSEEVGRVFLEAGVPCVIAVQSELKIEDKVAQSFSKIFYQELFNLKTIRESFEKAISVTQAKEDRRVFTCCCAHKHAANCKWAQAAWDEGYTELHSKHISACSCERAYQHIHKRNCQWAEQFTMEFMDEEEEEEEEEEEGNNPLNPDEIFICCCKKKSTPHDETLKFTLMFKNPEEIGEYPIFEEKEEGFLEEQNQLEYNNYLFSEVKIIGRNILIHRLFYFIRTKGVRFIQVSGESGVGKTELVKQTANYILERKNFIEEVIYETLEGVTSLTTFMSRVRGNCPTDEKFFTIYKTKRLLFIMDNCDSLIDNNGKALTKKLTAIANNTRNVKFILITLSTKKLDISEANLFVGPMDSLDAAKFFIVHAGDLLPHKYHNPQELSQHSLMTDFKRTPKELLLLAQNFQKEEYGGSFNKFCQKIKEKGLGESQVDFNNIGSTLGDLKSRNLEAYNLLLFLAQFPSGLLFEDLQTLATLKKIPENWYDLLIALTIEKPEREEKFLAKSVQLALTKRNSIEDKSEASSTEGQTAIAPNDYFWMKIEKDKKDRKYSLEVIHYLVKYIKEEKEHRNIDIELNGLEYLSHLSTIFIRQFKQEKKYYEKLIEHSKVSEEGFWSMDRQECCKEKESQEPSSNFKRSYNKSMTKYMEKNMDEIDLKKSFETHKNNFYNVLCLEDIKLIYSDLVKGDKEKEDTFLKALYTLCENVPTIFKMMGNINQAIELTEAAQSLCQYLQQEVKEHNQSLNCMQAKLHLMLIALLFNEAFFKNKDEAQYKKLEKTIYNLEEISKPWNLDLITVEIFFIKALIIYENCLKDYYVITFFSFSNLVENPKQFRNKKNPEFLRKKKTNYKENMPKMREALDYIKAGKDNFNELHLNEKHPILFGRIIILECKIRCFLPKNMELPSLQESLKRTCEIMKDKGLFYLEILALESMAEYMIKFTSNTSNENHLHLAKNNFCQIALDKAIKINDKTLESECKVLLDKIHRKIRKLYSHVFIFMRASPIVEAIPKETPRESMNVNSFSFSDTNQNPLLPVKKKSKDVIEDVPPPRSLKRKDSKRIGAVATAKKEFLMKNMGFSFLMSSSFKKNIIEKLKNLQITVKFEVLTRKNLVETLTKGCKIYHMNLEYENGYLLLEDELGALERMTMSDIKNIFSEQEKTYIDILILCSRDGSELAPFFHSLGIPCVVYFEFKPHENDLFLKHLQDICMNEFSLEFYEEICNNKSILGSFNRAKEKMISNIFDKYRYFIEELKMFEKMLGYGPKLYPITPPETISQIQYLPGDLDDISSVKAPTNIDKYDEIILGRKKDLYDIIKTLNDRNCVNIYGEKGIGKSKFARVLGYYMLRLGFKDGVFYFKLGDIRKKYNSDLRELMKTVFGEEFAKEIHCYFKNKEMLLVFDDYDEILKNDSDISSYMHIFCTLKEDNIPYILVTKNKLAGKKNIDKVALYHKLQPLDEAEAREFLEFKFREFFACYQIEESKQANITEDIKKIFELSKGYPKLLLRHYKDHLDQLRHTTNKSCHSPHRTSPYNRNSKGKNHMRKENRSTPDLRTLSEKKKSEGQLMMTIEEENEKDWKNRRMPMPAFQLEEDNVKIKSTSSVNEEDFHKTKTKTKRKMTKTVSYSPQFNSEKREILSPNITNSFHDFTSSEESSDDKSSNMFVGKKDDSDDEEDSYEELPENGEDNYDKTDGSEEIVRLVKSFSNEHKNKDDNTTISSQRTESEDPRLKKASSTQFDIRRKRGKTTGKQEKKFKKNKKNKYWEAMHQNKNGKGRPPLNESDEEEEKF